MISQSYTEQVSKQTPNKSSVSAEHIAGYCIILSFFAEVTNVLTKAIKWNGISVRIRLSHSHWALSRPGFGSLTDICLQEAPKPSTNNRKAIYLLNQFSSPSIHDASSATFLLLYLR